MNLTARALNRATLVRQLLVHRADLPVPDAVRAVLAVQAQEPASPYLALWNRLAPFDPADVDAAFSSQTIVKASLLRVTLHAVHAADYPVFHHALRTQLRSARLTDPRFLRAGLSAEDADAAVAAVLRFARTPRTNTELAAMLAQRFGALPEPGLWWAVRTYAPLVHAPTGAPWTFGPRPSYRTAPARQRRGNAESALRALARSYLAAFGPASVADLAQFAKISRAGARTALADQTLVRHTGPDGTALYDVPDARLPDESLAVPPRLMAMWDSVLLAYHDRSRIIPPDYRPLIIRSNGDVLPTLLVDGYVAGVWRPVQDGIEASAFAPIAAAQWRALAAEAKALHALLAERDPRVYGRFKRWWTDLPAAEVRVLPA